MALRADKKLQEHTETSAHLKEAKKRGVSAYREVVGWRRSFVDKLLPECREDKQRTFLHGLCASTFEREPTRAPHCSLTPSRGRSGDGARKASSTVTSASATDAGFLDLPSYDPVDPLALEVPVP